MSLKSKASIILGVAFIALLSAALYIFKFHLFKDFLAIERNLVQKDMIRAIEAIEAEKRLLRVTAIDWAQWDDAYKFMRYPTQEFKTSWSTYESYKALLITDTYFFDTKKNMIFGVRINFEKEKVDELHVNDALVRAIQNIPSVFQFDGEILGRVQIINTQGELLLVGSSPILDSNRQKQPRGTLVLIKKMDSAFISKIATQTRLAITFTNKPVPSSPIRLKYELPEIGGVIVGMDENLITGFTSLNNINGEVLTILAIAEPRPVSQQGRNTLVWLLFFWGIASAIVLSMALFLLNKTILSRLSNIGIFLNQVQKKKVFIDRLAMSSKDELGQLSNDINSMLESLGASHEQVSLARAAAERANKMKDYFASNFSHDLGNKLGGVLHLIRNALKHGTAPEICELLNNCQSEITQIHERTKRIIDMHKLETGNETFLKEPFSLRQTILNSRAQLLGLLSDKPVSIVFDIDPTTPLKLIGDVEKIGRVIENLLGNAAKFTHSGHVGLTVRAKLCDNLCSLTLEVWDTGIGIPKEKLTTIFEAFQHAHSAADGEAVGHGIGLFSTLKIIEGLGGKIELNSEVGKGSNFSVFIQLPISEKGGPPKPQNWPSLSLIIDDDAISGITLARNFSNRGADARHTTTADLPTAGEADIYIISERALNHPEIMGYAQARANQVIVLSNTTSTKVRTELRQIGINKFAPLPTIAEEVFHLWRRGFDSTTVKSPELTKAVRPTTILLADDNPAQVGALRQLFEAANYTVKTFVDGKGVVSAISALFCAPTAETATVVITDINMNGLSGTETTKAIRDLEIQYKRSSRIPIIALSGFVNPKIKKDLLTNGFDAVLDKLAGAEEFAKLFKTLLP